MLRGVRHLFVYRAAMRAALRKPVDATFAVRDQMGRGNRRGVPLRQPHVRCLVQQSDG